MTVDVEQVLRQSKALSAAQLTKLQNDVDEKGRGTYAAMAALDLVSPKVLKALSDAGVRVFDLGTNDPDPNALAVLDGKVARQHEVVPVAYEGDRLVVAMANPDDQVALDAVAASTGIVVEGALCPADAVRTAVDEIFGAGPRGKGEEGERTGLGELDDHPDLHALLEAVLDLGASDLHLSNGRPPVLRVNGDLAELSTGPLDSENLQQMLYGMLSQAQRERFEETLELDCAYSLPGKARFRVNIYQQRGALGAAFRLVPFEIHSVEDLGLPVLIEDFSHLPRGLVVVTGPTGSGKSTTLAALVDVVNRERAVHIMTIEDPIEFLHPNKTALVNQREVGQDTHSFAEALKHVLRQDPDVILVGEMRDLETIQMAVTAAETGHLVFATLHTQDAPQSVDRMIDVFPSHQQQQIRVQLASTLQGVVSQQLLPTADGDGRVAACEVLVATPAVRNLIREAKTHQIYSLMQAGGRFGMQTMDAALAGLARSGQVSLDTARERCHNADEFSRLAGSARGA